MDKWITAERGRAHTVDIDDAKAEWIDILSAGTTELKAKDGREEDDNLWLKQVEAKKDSLEQL